MSNLVDALNKQNIDSFEVIFVNDHSTDNSVNLLLSRLKGSFIKFKVLDLAQGTGKKAALTLGINNAEHSIIVTTDADCTMNPDWLSLMTSQFQNKAINLVTGPVKLRGNNFIQRFQSLEMSALIGVTAASIRLNKPTMANGANLAFRKSTFYKLEGYHGIDQIPSGDDELFMHKVQKNFPGSIKFKKDSRAIVTTEAEPTIADMVSQKRRWASKWKINKRRSTVFLSLSVLAVNLSQLVLIYETLTRSENLQVSLWAILLKCLVELFLLAKVRMDFGQQNRIIDYLISFLFYPIYAIYIGLAANFGSYQWKGRRYS